MKYWNEFSISHEGCKRLRIKVQPAKETLVANVYSSGLNYHHNPNDNGLTNHVKAHTAS